MYTELAEIAIPGSAQFIGPDAIQLTFSARDHERKIKRTLIKTLFRPWSEDNYASSLQEVDYVACLYSPSGRKRVVLREVKNGPAGSKRFVEIWGKDSLQVSLDVTERNGAFYTDDYLGSVSFDRSESAIVYTAEGLPPKEDSGDPYSQFRFRPDLGEGLSGKKRPTTFIVREDAGQYSISPLQTPANVYFGQCVLSTTSTTTIYATGYELQPDGRLLGVKGCFNRPSGIWQISLPQDGGVSGEAISCTVEKLTPPELSCRSPRVVQTGETEQLLWISGPSGGPHVSTSSLHSLEVGQLLLKELVGIVNEPEADGFPGLYPPPNLPLSPLLSIGSDSPTHVVVHSHVGSRTLVVFVSLADGKRCIWDPEGANGPKYSWSVLATDGGSRVVCSRSTPSIPYEVVLVEVRDLDTITWKVVDTPSLTSQVSKALSSIQTSILQIPDRAPIETIVIRSSPETKEGSEPPPCILIPHGGPHATTTTAFSPATTALALEGYTLSLPNYTGSPGYGEASIRALVGQCGRKDVDDCIASLDHLIKLGIAQEGPGKLFVMGGSHGGFLTAHLIGQFPGRFSASVMRNPVISGGETSTTDIPDWYFSEFGFSYPIRSSPLQAKEGGGNKQGPIPPLMTGALFGELQSMSPISYVNSVQAPVLLLIGLADRRVAPTHGFEYYYALKARFQDEDKVQLLAFEGESHPLDGVEAAKVCFEAGRDWFEKVRRGRVEQAEKRQEGLIEFSA